LRALLPTAEETISYAMPAFKVDGIALAGLAGFNSHCSYFPHSGATLERIPHLLAGYDHDAGTLRFPIDKPLPITLLRALIAARVAAEEAHGPRAGIARHFYANGTLRAKGRVRDKEMHGPWSWYRKDGSLMRTGHFKAGEQTGIWQTFDRGGRLVKETTF
jgi:uncharacterized protein YdhG (YjbR/CyaY superfamily)